MELVDVGAALARSAARWERISEEADPATALAKIVETETVAPCLFLQGAAGDLSPNPSGPRTPDDFGLQGGRPTHPDLLDWLAVEFMNRGWSIKEMHRLLMTSEAMRCYYNLAFWLKMWSLLLAMIFTFTVRRRTVTADAATLTPIRAKVVGLISLLLWSGVGIGGRGIGFY
jgi:hypothetical protein